MRRQKFLLFRVYRFQDNTAYAELYDLYYQKIRRYIFFKVPRAEDADELTAEVFLRGWEYATSSRVENSGALFYRIAQNLIADFYRKRQVDTSIDQIEEVAQQGRSLADQIAQSEEEKALIQSLQKLKEEYRDVLVMKFLDEMSVKEIALILEKTPNNIRVTLYRAKKALREIHK